MTVTVTEAGLCFLDLLLRNDAHFEIVERDPSAVVAVEGECCVMACDRNSMCSTKMTFLYKLITAVMS